MGIVHHRPVIAQPPSKPWGGELNGGNGMAEILKKCTAVIYYGIVKLPICSSTCAQ